MTTTIDAYGATAFTPYWCRVRDAGSATPVLGDLAAAALAPQVAGRFGRVSVSDATRVGCCLRNLTVDGWLRELAVAGRIGTVVDLGVGLDTRLRRLPNITRRYIEVDSAPIIALRDEWIRGTGAVRIAADAMSVATWIDNVPAAESMSTAVVLEGVLAYRSPAKVATFFRDLAERLPGAYVLFDSMSPLAAWPANRPAALVGGRPHYAWSTWSTARLVTRPRRWRVLEERGFMDLPRELTRSLTGRGRLLYSLPLLRRGYRLTLAQLPTRGE